MGDPVRMSWQRLSLSGGASFREASRCSTIALFLGHQIWQYPYKMLQIYPTKLAVQLRRWYDSLYWLGTILNHCDSTRSVSQLFCIHFQHQPLNWWNSQRAYFATTIQGSLETRKVDSVDQMSNVYSYEHAIREQGSVYQLASPSLCCLLVPHLHGHPALPSPFTYVHILTLCCNLVLCWYPSPALMLMHILPSLPSPHSVLGASKQSGLDFGGNPAAVVLPQGGRPTERCRVPRYYISHPVYT